MRAILGSHAPMNKTHIGRRPKWFAIQNGGPPNWLRANRALEIETKEDLCVLLSAYCVPTSEVYRVQRRASAIRLFMQQGPNVAARRHPRPISCGARVPRP